MTIYKPKSQIDLALGEIERGIRYELNLAAANAKQRIVNEVLPLLQQEFEAELAATGKLLKLSEAKGRVENLTKEILGELVAVV